VTVTTSVVIMTYSTVSMTTILLTTLPLVT
jgi:hypothetical protein